VHENPHRTTVGFQATLSQLGDQTAQGEVLVATADEQPHAMLTRDRPLLVTTHLPR